MLLFLFQDGNRELYEKVLLGANLEPLRPLSEPPTTLSGAATVHGPGQLSVLPTDADANNP